MTETLSSTWDRMRVSTITDLAEYRFTGTAASDALVIIDAAFNRVAPARHGGFRAVPSAGAIYPYECYIIADEGDELAAFHADPSARRCCRLPLSPSQARRCLDSSGLGPPPQDGALIMIAIRPWLSMRKYGERGYLYAQLDAGHLAANILGHLTCSGIGGAARLRLPRRPLSRLLDLDSRCREIHSVLTMTPSGRPTPGDPADPAWQLRDARDQRNAGSRSASEAISWLELECWRSLLRLFAYDPSQRERLAPANGSAYPGAVANGADRDSPLASPLIRLRPGLPTGTPRTVGTQWDALSRARSSCKRFGSEPITNVQLFEILSAVLTPVITDIPSDAVLHATLISRRVSGMPDGIYRLTGTGPGQVTDPPAADEIVPACMQQEHLKDAAALVLFHVARDELLGRHPARMRELLFRAGALGQLLYLGAAGAGVGVTAVGGFDARRWRHLGRLPADHEVLYILMFGHGAGTGIKWDRLATAYAHGEQ